MQTTLDKAIELIALIDKGRVSTEDFQEIITVIAAFVKEAKGLSDREMAKLRSLVDDELKNVQSKNSAHTEAAKSLLIKLIEERVAQIKDGDPGPPGRPGEPGPPGRDADTATVVGEVLARLPPPPPSDTPPEIISKVQSLSEGERWSIRDVNGLEEELKKLRKKAGGTTVISAVGGGGGRIVKVHDLSGSLNGSTTTFSLPAFYRVLSVQISSFPNVLRPTTDYTTDGAAMTITFTSEIDPATSLASGQTCVILYAEI